MILVTGASGFLGTAVCAELAAQGHAYTGLYGRQLCDLRDVAQIDQLLGGLCPSTVIHCAYPGTDGIATSLRTPFDLAQTVLQIDQTVIRACARRGIARLICMGSTCAYPARVTSPVTEEQLWTGAPDSVNAAYGHAKRMQLALLHAATQQYGLSSCQLILGNLYGPGDQSGHVLPSLIRKVQAACAHVYTHVVAWGDGSATRPFLYVEDAARAIVSAAQLEGALPDACNIVAAERIPISYALVEIMRRLGYTGGVQWDRAKPMGAAPRTFSHARATQVLGWTPTTTFADGLAQTLAVWETR